MKDIRVSRVGEQEFELSIDEDSYLLDQTELKVMLARVVEAFAGKPKAGGGGRAGRRKEFFKHLLSATNPGIQSLLRAAEHEDVLCILKVNEGDDVFRGKFFVNMSPTQQKVFREDLNYKYKEAPPQSVLNTAVDRLMAVCSKLEAEGLLEYDG